jgi:hypothetical protein
MSDFVVIRNLKASLGDVYITGGEPVENLDYNLMVDVCLEEIREKKSTGEEDGGKKTYIFQPVGQIRLVKMQEREVLPPDAEAPNPETRNS